jgi:hypothetical protein
MARARPVLTQPACSIDGVHYCQIISRTSPRRRAGSSIGVREKELLAADLVARYRALTVA